MRNKPGIGKVALFAVYAATVGGAFGLFMSIRAIGERGNPVAAQPPTAASQGHIDTLLHVLLAMAVIIVVTRVVGLLFAKLRQPSVVGEVIGGIVLGPSLLGRIAPEATAYVLPSDVAPFLGVIAQLGVILYMFLVGLELDLRTLRRTGHITLAISHASIVAPFVLGSLTALALYERLAGSGVSFTVFALFVGVSMSVTAFPVLARILTDRQVHKTRLGTVAITCAAVDDATAWCLLAFVVCMAQARMDDALRTLGLTAVFVVAVIFVGAPLVRRWLPRVERSPELSKGGLSIIFVALLLSALATEYIGIHAIFGAFLLGAVVPHDSPVVEKLTQRLEGVVSVLFLPAFFAFTGLRTQIGLIDGLENWLICGLIILVACAGKFGGTLVAARLTGQTWRDASALGILMNTRGLVELIVLNIGLDLGVISPTLFAMLVIMALVTTFMTAPLLDFLVGEQAWEERPLPDHRAESV